MSPTFPSGNGGDPNGKGDCILIDVQKRKPLSKDLCFFFFFFLHVVASSQLFAGVSVNMCVMN